VTRANLDHTRRCVCALCEAEQRARALIAALPDDAELERRANLDESALTALSDVREDALRDVILEGCWVDVARAELARRGLPP